MNVLFLYYLWFIPIVPDAPEKIKAIVSGEETVIISWLPPRRPNGVLSKYTVFIRVLDKGQEVKIIKVTELNIY